MSNKPYLRRSESIHPGTIGRIRELACAALTHIYPLVR